MFLPPAFELAPGLDTGDTIRMGRKLFMRAS